MWKASREVTYSFFYNLLPPRESSLPSVQNISKMVTRSYGTTRLYAQESRDIFSLVSGRYHNLFHWIQEKELVSGNKLEWPKRQLYSLSLSLSLSSLPSFFPFAPFVFSLVFLIDCLKQTWFSLLCNFLFTSSIWVAFQCNIHKQQTLYSHRYVNFTFVLVREYKRLCLV